MTMTLPRRLAAGLLGGVLLILPASFSLEFFRAKASNRRLTEWNLALLSQREQQNVESIHRAVDLTVADSLGRGEMGVFSKLVEFQKQIPGFLEFSLYNQSGEVTYSSDKAALRRTLAPELKQGLLASPVKLVRTNLDAIEIYEPRLAVASCKECHDDFKTGEVCGVTYFRFANDAITRMQTRFMAAEKESSQAILRQSALTTLGALLSAGALVLWITRRAGRTLTGIATALRTHAAAVRHAADEVAENSRRVAEGASEQAASLEETSASLEEISSMTRANAEHARTAKALTGRAHAAADGVGGAMQDLARAMEEIRAASRNIATIIKTIDEIAFQTNILALNAAVEAARAGTAGMGFAVVAGEVRNLAQRSAAAAKETEQRIQDSIRKSEHGAGISVKVAQDLGEIVDFARQIDQLVALIADASEEQSRGVQEVSSAVTGMDKVIQSDAAMAQESASTAETLRTQAAALTSATNALADLMGERNGGMTSTPSGPTASKPAARIAQPVPETALLQPLPAAAAESNGVEGGEALAGPFQGRG